MRKKSLKRSIGATWGSQIKREKVFFFVFASLEKASSPQLDIPGQHYGLYYGSSLKQFLKEHH